MSLALVPTVWLAHFLAAYVLVSLACSAGVPGVVVPGIALATLAALAFYAWLGARSFRRRGAGGATAFQARTNLLLCCLSTVGTLWVAYPAFVLAPCLA